MEVNSSEDILTVVDDINFREAQENDPTMGVGQQAAWTGRPLWRLFRLVNKRVSLCFCIYDVARW